MLTNLLQRGYLWQFWYLGATMLLYACLPLLYRLREKGWLGRLWVCLAVAGEAMMAISYFAGASVQNHVPQTFRLWTHMQYFILGGIFGSGNLPRLLRRLQGVSMKAHTLLLLAVTAGVVAYQYWTSRCIFKQLSAEQYYDSAFTVLWLATLFAWIMRLPVPGKARPAIAELSSLTLGVYILHVFVIQVELKFFRWAHIPASQLVGVGALLLSTLGAFVISKIPVVNSMIRLTGWKRKKAESGGRMTGGAR